MAKRTNITSLPHSPSHPFQVIQRSRPTGGGGHRRHGKSPHAAPFLAGIARTVLVARVRFSINGRPGQQHPAAEEAEALLQERTAARSAPESPGPSPSPPAFGGPFGGAEQLNASVATGHADEFRHPVRQGVVKW